MQVTVTLDKRTYPIWIGRGLLAQAGSLIGSKLAHTDVIILTDNNIAQTYLAPLQATLEAAQISVSTHILPAGEQTKSFQHLEQTLNHILSIGIERKTSLIALGGGVIGDFTGLCASLLLRGIPFYQIPTSLLAQVDSSVGGKTSINSPFGKNLIGTFYQPQAVIIDTNCLKTLPIRDLKSGYAEILKYGLLGNRRFFNWLRDHAPALLAGDAKVQTKAIEISCQMKADIVAEDEQESGKRALLNLGHTFGHALEAESGYSEALTHGEGVAIGMMMAFEFSHDQGLCSAEDVTAVADHLDMVGVARHALSWTSPEQQAEISAEQWADRFLSHMRKDKKVSQGKLTFILARGIGDSFITQDIDPITLRQYLISHIQAKGNLANTT